MSKRGGFPGGMAMPGGMNNMLKQAQRMQQKMEAEQAELAKKEEELEAEIFEGSAGGGVVKTSLSGAKKVMSVSIDPEVIDKDDVETLEELVMASVNDALSKVLEAEAKLTEGLDMTGMGSFGMKR